MATAVLLARCAIYDSSLLLSAPGDAAADVVTPDAAGVLDAGVDADPCAHAHAPPSPTNEDGTADMDVVLAATFIRILPVGTIAFPHPAPPTGLDLDNRCSCPAPESCKPRGTTRHCDGDGGADDSAGELFAGFAALSSTFTDDSLNAGLRAGQFSVLFRIRSYNGGKNDKQVTTVVYSAKGLVNNADSGVSPAPAFDGSDSWLIDPSSLLGGSSVDAGTSCEGKDSLCIPLFADTQSYVKDGVLVAHVDFPITVGAAGGQIVLSISAGTILAKLIVEGGSLRIDEGQVAGRWNAGSLLTTLGESSDPIVKGNVLCKNAVLYQNLKSRVCNAADLMTRPTDDSTGKVCDALSVAATFSASPAHLGPIYSKPSDAPACGPSWKDDCP